MKARLLAALLLLSAPALADGFDHLVSTIESHYGIKRMHIPLMGVANFAVKVAHLGGAHGFKLAIFQDLESCETCFELEDLDDLIAHLSDSSMHLLVQTHSHGEATYIMAGDIGKTTRMLVATFGSSQATLVEVTVDLKTLLRTISSHTTRATDWTD